LSVTCDTSVGFFPGTLVTSTNKTDRHDISKILLKVVLNICIFNILSLEIHTVWVMSDSLFVHLLLFNHLQDTSSLRNWPIRQKLLACTRFKKGLKNWPIRQKLLACTRFKKGLRNWPIRQKLLACTRFKKCRLISD
jgi:hypothetical protein